MATQIGIVKALIGTATATAPDGSIRNLQIGDPVYADELVSTGAGGAIELEFADGSVMDLGRNSQAMLDDSVFNPTEVAETAATAESDVDALQQALLDGLDPTQALPATAAGAGTQTDGNEGTTAVVVDYLAPEVTPESGFDTIGVANEFPVVEEELGAPDEQPLAGVVPDPESSDESVTISAQGVEIIEGTSQVGDGSEAGTRVVAFTLSLDKVYTQDVQVTYIFRTVGGDNEANTYGTASEGGDWFDGDGPITVTIPAGTLTFPVYVNIVEDNIVEENGQFEIVLIDAVNATINPDASMVTVTIIDDDNYLPTVEVTAQLDIARDVGESQNLLETGTLTANGTVTPVALDGINSLTVEVFLNGVSQGFAVVTGNSWSLDLGQGTEGVDYEIEAVATVIDATGDQASANATASDSLPTVAVTADVDIARDDATSGTITATGTVTPAAIDGVNTVDVEVFLNGVSQGSAVVIGNSWSLDLGTGTEGVDYEVTAVATVTDNDGDADQATSAPASDALPTVAVTADVDIARDDATSGTITATGTVTPAAIDGVNTVDVEVFLNGVSQGSAVVIGNSWSLDLGTGTEGVDYEVTAVATVTDNDGDADQATSAPASDALPVIAPVNAILDNSVPNELTGLLNVASIDGVSSVALTPDTNLAGYLVATVNNVETELTSDGYKLVVVSDGNGGFSAVVEDSGDGVQTNAGDTIFTVTLNGDGTYSVNLIGNLDGSDEEIEFDLSNGIKGGNDDDFFLFEPGLAFDNDTPYDGDLNDNTEIFGPGVGEENLTVIKASGFLNDGSGALTVNTSDFSIGVGGGQDVDGTKTLKLEFTTADSWISSDDGGNASNDGILVAPTPRTNVNLSSVEFGLRAFSVGEVALITLYDWQDLVSADGVDDTLVEIGTLTITNNSGINFINSSVLININQDGVVAVDGIDVGATTDLQTLFDGNTSWNFDTVELTGSAGTDYKVTSITTTEELTGVDQSLSVTADVTDTDTDADSSSFEIVFDGTGTIVGTDSDDVLSGGDGNDILTGLAGDDIFQFNSGDDGTGIAPAADIVTDFNDLGESDVIDIADLLVGEESGTLTDYLSVTEIGGDVVVDVTPDGGADMTQTITLQNTTFVDLGVTGVNQTDIVDQMVALGHINIDS